MKRIVLTILILLTAIGLSAQAAMTAEDIIERLESNQVPDTSEMKAKMIITDQFGTRTKTIESIAKGEELTLIEFTNIEERGMKILRTEDVIYVYFPDAEDIMPIGGSAMRDSVAGSDMSYEDMTGDKGILDDYDVTLEGMEEVSGVNCYKLHMQAKHGDVAYDSQDLWVDAELFTMRQVYRYSLSGKLLKEMTILKVERIGGRNVPVEFVLKDSLKRNSQTEFIITDIDFDMPLSDDLFSLEELSW